jgi:hypothetical protein
MWGLRGFWAGKFFPLESTALMFATALAHNLVHKKCAKPGAKEGRHDGGEKNVSLGRNSDPASFLRTVKFPL